MRIACFEIDHIPDLSLNKYQSLADTGVEGVLKRHESFLRQWHGICAESKTSIHLLYTYIPSEPMGQRMKAFFLIQGEETAVQMVVPLLKKSPLSDFFTFKKAVLPDITFGAGATLTKKERLADIYNPMTGQTSSTHYVPAWEMNENARLYDLFRMMETISQAYTPHQACAFRIDLYAVSLETETRNSFAPVLKALRGGNDIKLTKEADSLKSDSYAKDVCEEYENWLTCIETTPHFRMNLYGFGADTFKARMLLNAAGSEALDEGDFSLAQLRPDTDGSFHVKSRMRDKAAAYCYFPDQAALPGWSTTYSLEEVTSFFRFPVLYDGENIEIPKETAPAPVENGICLGKDKNGYPVKIALKDLPKHAFFTGMPGSGKTNTMLHLVTELRKNGIPFLALEPAKKEYRALLAYKEMQDVCLFSPHLQSKFPLQMNPMEFPVGVRLSEHINALLEVFEGSFVLEGPTYKFLSSSIERSYTKLGWDIEDVNTKDCKLPYPSLQDVYDNLQREIEASSYDAELKGNVRAFLQVRLGGLMERDAGELFNVGTSTIKPERWLNISAIVELEVLTEQAKNFFVLMVCHYILESLRANPKGGKDKNGNLLPVRHVVFIEEAHNIIAPSTQQAGSDSVDPKISATAYIVKMLAEVRALREAIVIADQLPTALASEVTKNTGLKLVHRLTSQDDREQIGTAISASSLQMERMAAFRSGRALIYHEKTMKPFEVQITQWVSSDPAFDTSDDELLYARLHTLPQIRYAVKIAFRNWQDKYVFQTDDRLSRLQDMYLKAKDRTEQLRCLAEKAILLAECRGLQAKGERFRKLWILSGSTCGPLLDEMKDNRDYINGMIERLNLIK